MHILSWPPSIWSPFFHCCIHNPCGFLCNFFCMDPCRPCIACMWTMPVLWLPQCFPDQFCSRALTGGYSSTFHFLLVLMCALYFICGRFLQHVLLPSPCMYLPFYVFFTSWPHSHFPRITLWTTLACPNVLNYFACSCVYRCASHWVTCVFLVIPGWIHMYISCSKPSTYLPILCTSLLSLPLLWQLYPPLTPSSTSINAMALLGSGQLGKI